MAGRLLRFPVGDPLETALAAAAELDRDQLEQLREHVTALLGALAHPPPPPVTPEQPARSPLLAGLPHGPRGGGWIEWKWVRQGQRVYGPYPYLRFRLAGRQRSIYLKALAQAARQASPE